MAPSMFPTSSAKMARQFRPLLNNSSKRQKLELGVQNSGDLFKSTIAEFWGSDDDDVILLATQQAEENQRQPDSPRQTENEFELRPFVSSTQQPHRKRLSTSRQSPAYQPRHVASTSPEDETIKFSNSSNFRPNKDNPLLPEVQHVQNEPTISNTSHWATSRQVAQERQLKLLMERVDILQKENSKLQKDLLDHKSQTGTKDGEVKLLRYELQQARKLLQMSKMEKIIMAEEAKKDCNRKVADVYKEVIAKNTELTFTNVEFSEYKIRNTNNSFKNQQLTVYDTDECRNILRVENLCITRFNTQFSINAENKLYDFSKETRTQKKQRSFFELELEHLIFLNAELQLQANTDTMAMDRVISSVRGVFKEFLSYAQTLELPKHHLVYPYHHYDLQFDHNTCQRHSLIQTENLYKLERGVLLRRYIATLALICQRHGNLSQTLIKNKSDNSSILQIVIEAINKLSYSSEVLEHFGVIEATGAFLHSLLSNINAVYTHETQLDSLFNLFKQLVFTRPNIWVFQQLSSCMLLCALHDQIMERMCTGTNNNCFVSDRVRSKYRFRPESCLIQVYAGLLELCFCGDIPLNSTHFKLLLSICGNHVRFVYQGFISMPKFIMKMHPFQTFAEYEGPVERLTPKIMVTSSTNSSNNNNTAIPSKIGKPAVEQLVQESNCECYVKLCISVVTLVFQMMYQWTLQVEKSDVSHVGEISQTALHLLILIFREYYLPSIFRDSEETTKHNLSLLCGWWKEHMHILRFQDTHLHFLNQLEELQFMLKPMHHEANHSNPDTDLADWKSIVNKGDMVIDKFDSLQSEFNFNTLYLHKMNDFFNNLKSSAKNNIYKN
ncbi:ATR-interacting protein mus304 [Drosophila albomicans]|uniref:ATR-interacting protein mus304 n=1 Tax=Drosophila albomicans TaxID=7291 RepID=A0A6P8WNQ3_DROAB|nr:ATR-interacting protein mus304 [Drosophila albomicans]